MKIELKHLAGYLPYSLKGIHTQFGFDKVIHILEGVYSYGDILTDFDEFGMEYFKPVLHPLSDLTKEIEHNGEKFVPIDYFLGNDIDDILNAVQVNDLSYLPYNLIQKLYEWHFDINGLIENNLAIDINTLEQ